MAAATALRCSLTAPMGDDTITNDEEGVWVNDNLTTLANAAGLLILAATEMTRSCCLRQISPRVG